MAASKGARKPKREPPCSFVPQQRTPLRCEKCGRSLAEHKRALERVNKAR
jgi:hypothetical protein